MRLATVLLICALSVLTLPACKLTARLPYYRDSNEQRPSDAQPYEVMREQPYPRALIDPALSQRGQMSRSLDYVFGLATGWLPEDVAESNRKKLERAIGRGLSEDERTNPVHADPFPDIDVILAISGGGHRAANLGSAVMYELSKLRLDARNGRPVSLLDAVDSVSSVSGGGFAAAFYVYHRSVYRGNDDPGKAERHGDLIKVGMRENIQLHLLDALILPTKISFWIRGFTRATRTNLYSNLLEYRIIRPQRLESLQAAIYPSWWKNRKLIYGTATLIKDFLWILSPVTPDDQYLFGVPGRTFDDLYLRDPDNPSVLYPLRPEWLINSTAYNKPVDDNQFLFEANTFNRLDSDWMEYRVSDAVAASASFPVLFVPTSLRDYSSKPNTWLFIFDGGVSDNQGMNGVREALARKPASNSAVVIMVDASPRSGIEPSKEASRPGSLAVTNRALERYMDEVRDQSISELRALEKPGNFRFFHLSIRPEEFGAPLTDEEAKILEAANGVPTALKISRDNQKTLFEVGRLLVGRDRDAMLSAVQAGSTGAAGQPVGAGAGEIPPGADAPTAPEGPAAAE